MVFAAFEPFHSCEFRASIARTPFCAILWRSPTPLPGAFGLQVMAYFLAEPSQLSCLGKDIASSFWGCGPESGVPVAGD